MVKILFVCHGNICRSPMAEFVMKELVRQAGQQIYVASAATSTEEIGNPVYPPARRKLAEHGIDCAGKTARQMDRGDYEAFDLLVGMDRANLRNMTRICGGDPQGKLHLLMEYADRQSGSRGERSRSGMSESCRCSLRQDEGYGACGDEVADPWYTGDFEAAWQDVLAGCRGLLAQLTREGERP